MPNLIGIGYAGMTTKKFMHELQAANVTVLVDVRAWPQSRTAPYDFNRKRIEATLHQHGIKYLWLGETLGNPKDDHERRTLEGFSRWMQTPDYQQGINELLQIVQRSSGTVALLCVERDENECHRRMILRDLRRRLAVEALPSLPTIPAKPGDLRDTISLLVRAAILYRGLFYQSAARLDHFEITPTLSDAVAMAHILLDKWADHLEIITDDHDPLLSE